MATPLVYLILGCKGSGQFQIVADLIDFGTDTDESSAVFYSVADAAEAETDVKVATRTFSLGTYGWESGVLSLEVGSEADLVFVVADGLADPADFVEAFHAWLPQSGCELGRVMTALHCELAVGKHEAYAWFDCCIHFSDVVLLGRRDAVSNKDMKKFLDHYEEECFPCIFEYVKKGRVSNPRLLLETQPRRISRIFEEPDAFEVVEEPLVLDIEIDGVEEDDVVINELADEDDAAGDPTKDKYLRRVAGGRRAHPLPKIGEHL